MKSRSSSSVRCDLTTARRYQRVVLKVVQPRGFMEPFALGCRGGLEPELTHHRFVERELPPVEVEFDRHRNASSGPTKRQVVSPESIFAVKLRSIFTMSTGQDALRQPQCQQVRR